MTGWYNDRNRHSLASVGAQTKPSIKLSKFKIAPDHIHTDYAGLINSYYDTRIDFSKDFRKDVFNYNTIRQIIEQPNIALYSYLKLYPDDVDTTSLVLTALMYKPKSKKYSKLWIEMLIDALGLPLSAKKLLYEYYGIDYKNAPLRSMKLETKKFLKIFNDIPDEDIITKFPVFPLLIPVILSLHDYPISNPNIEAVEVPLLYVNLLNIWDDRVIEQMKFPDIGLDIDDYKEIYFKQMELMNSILRMDYTDIDNTEFIINDLILELDKKFLGLDMRNYTIKDVLSMDWVSNEDTYMSIIKIWDIYETCNNPFIDKSDITLHPLELILLSNPKIGKNFNELIQAIPIMYAFGYYDSVFEKLKKSIPNPTTPEKMIYTMIYHHEGNIRDSKNRKIDIRPFLASATSNIINNDRKDLNPSMFRDIPMELKKGIHEVLYEIYTNAEMLFTPDMRFREDVYDKLKSIVEEKLAKVSDEKLRESAMKYLLNKITFSNLKCIEQYHDADRTLGNLRDSKYDKYKNIYQKMIAYMIDTETQSEYFLNIYAYLHGVSKLKYVYYSKHSLKDIITPMLKNLLNIYEINRFRVNDIYSEDVKPSQYMMAYILETKDFPILNDAIQSLKKEVGHLADTIPIKDKKIKREIQLYTKFIYGITHFKVRRAYYDDSYESNALRATAILKALVPLIMLYNLLDTLQHKLGST